MGFPQRSLRHGQRAGRRQARREARARPISTAQAQRLRKATDRGMAGLVVRSWCLYLLVCDLGFACLGMVDSVAPA